MTTPATAAATSEVTTPARSRSRLGAWLVAAMVAGVVTLTLVAEPPVRVAGTAPADGAVLAAPPAEFSMTVSTEVEPVEIHMSVVPAGGGPRVSTDEPRRADRMFGVPLAITAAGDYLAAYHLMLPDGRELSGFSRFVVAGVGGAATQGPAAGSDGPTGADTDVAAGTGSGTDAGGVGHAHAGDDPFSLGLLAVDLVLVAVAVVVLFIGPVLFVGPGRRATRIPSRPASGAVHRGQ